MSKGDPTSETTIIRASYFRDTCTPFALLGQTLLGSRKDNHQEIHCSCFNCDSHWTASDGVSIPSEHVTCRRSRQVRTGGSRVGKQRPATLSLSGRRLATSKPVISSTSPLLPPRPHPPHLRARHLAARISPSRVASLLHSRRFLCFRRCPAVRAPTERPVVRHALSRQRQPLPSTILDFHPVHHRSWSTSANLSVDSALNVAAADPILTQFLLAIAINNRHHEHPLFSLFQRSAEDHPGDPVWSFLA